MGVSSWYREVDWYRVDEDCSKLSVFFIAEGLLLSDQMNFRSAAMEICTPYLVLR